MIRITQIDDKFSIYRDNIVVLLGIGESTNEFIDLFHYHDVGILYLCDNNEDNLGKVIQGVPVISFLQFKNMVCNGSNDREIVVQISKNYISDNLKNDLSNMDIKSVITFEEAHKILSIMRDIKKYKLNKNKPIQTKAVPINKDGEKAVEKKSILLENHPDTIYIAQPQKTGDMTLLHTFKASDIPFYFTDHSTALFKEWDNSKKIKITTAVRDQISKDISNLYQNISAIQYCYLFDIIKDKKDFFAFGGDAQELLNIYLKINMLNYPNNKISAFMEMLKRDLIDLSAHPFDKEKGYTIVKEGNIEVFVYQLEKMNDIVKEMSDWAGGAPFDKWVMSNEASNKWIADSYKQAQKEITFPQEYVDRCYNDPWFEHFYSEKDIEKFKERWRPHIRK